MLLVVFLEAAGAKSKVVKVTGKDEKGKPITEVEEITIFQEHGKAFAAVFLIIAILIFVNSGVLGLLGLQGIQITEQSTLSIAFFILILIAVAWMISDPK